MRASRREGQGQRGAVYSEHVNAADRSDANQAALGSQARHRWLRLDSLALAATRSLGEATLESRALAYGRVAQRGEAEAVPCRGRQTRPSSRPLGREPDRRQFPNPASIDSDRAVGTGRGTQPGRSLSGRLRAGTRASRLTRQGRCGAVCSDHRPAAYRSDASPAPAVPKPGTNGCRSARCEPPSRTRPPRRGGLRQQQSSQTI